MLRELKTFLVAAKAGSFAGAGQRVSLNPIRRQRPTSAAIRSIVTLASSPVRTVFQSIVSRSSIA
jgi:hypothetical protein